MDDSSPAQSKAYSPWRPLQTLGAALSFYTCWPIPLAGAMDFRGVAHCAPLVGIILGSVLVCLDQGLSWLSMPTLTRTALVVATWLAMTGGLHLDGAMDTADGLAVTDPERRLQVMADSRTGAFGAMAAVVILLLKTVALAELSQGRSLALIAACGWGRWGQQVAIAAYPYLKPTGKGAFHKQAIRSGWHTLPSIPLLLGLSVLQWWLEPTSWPRAIAMTVGGGGIAVAVAAWMHSKLGGHTGDTYGATVEWTEALLLCLLTAF